jgi:predicted RNA-binding Zn ribbon-like protein
MASDSQAPQPLELVREFVNSFDVEVDEDGLATPPQLGQWLAEHGLPGPSGPSEADRERAIELREALRALLLANGGEPLDRAAIETLNRIAGELRLLVRFGEDGEGALEPAGGGVEAALGAILGIVFRSMADGSWPRLKACHEHTCQWAFFDQSRNRSATWCSMAVCGNRNKARNYRERQRATNA